MSRTPETKCNEGNLEKQYLNCYIVEFYSTLYVKFIHLRYRIFNIELFDNFYGILTSVKTYYTSSLVLRGMKGSKDL